MLVEETRGRASRPWHTYVIVPGYRDRTAHTSTLMQILLVSWALLFAEQKSPRFSWLFIALRFRKLKKKVAKIENKKNSAPRDPVARIYSGVSAFPNLLNHSWAGYPTDLSAECIAREFSSYIKKKGKKD